MGYDFEDHCWKDVMSADLLRLARRSEREVKVGPSPALLAVDLYERVYQGGPVPVAEAAKEYPHSCGEHAWAAIEPTVQLFEAARAAGLPIFYSTDDPAPDVRPPHFWTTRAKAPVIKAEDFEIRPEWKPQSGDVVIRKQRASAFYGTPLVAHLNAIGIRTLIMCGESTSGCLRASAVEAQENGYHVVVVEECCFDRNIVSHKVNLFDLHHKYADVMHLDEVVTHLDSLRK
ncbi:MAG: isochorismatase family protein [Haliea sp.]